MTSLGGSQFIPKYLNTFNANIKPFVSLNLNPEFQYYRLCDTYMKTPTVQVRFQLKTNGLLLQVLFND